jgi:hypothetical protein
MSWYILLSLICLLMIPTLSFAKSNSTETVGHLSASATVAQWSAAGNYERIDLTVVGPNGAVYHKEFAAGSTPQFRPQDLGGRLTDGSYTYELRVVPRISDEVKKQLAAARAANDDAAAARIQLAAGISANPVAQSGNLLVVNGAFVSSDAQEPAAKQPVSSGPTASSISAPKIAPLDIVQADDVIIQGSLCVGLDCVNNESFGFDTIRLKENNTRIKFEDTSTGTGFPTHDWQLTANDSASGGAEKFSIEDITAATVPFTVTGSAPTNSIFVDSTGRLGLRTATPVLDIHVATSNTPAMRLEQNNSGGFTAQTWDVGGNEANFFVRDVTGGSRLPFRIRPGAPTSSIDINANGNVGIGIVSPSNRLHVFTTTSSDGLSIDGTTFPAIVLRISGTIKGYAPAIVTANGGFFSNSSTGDFAFRSETNKILFGVGSGAATMAVSGNNVGIGTVTPGSQLVIASGATTSSINAGATQFTVASSRTFKENIEPTDVPDILQKIEAVPVVTYDFKNNGPKNRLGLIAEDFHTVLGRGDDKHIDGQDVQMALWMAVQKLTAENKALTDRLSKLEAAQQKPQP